ncbi:TPA: hypothetical protein I8608_000569 [Morganella morganii]|uniref:Uncharacterized protein n=1 Tax=Morganella morganii TaxID=582 RepID=A0AAN5MEB8_MORMO|nr:hypothetical protein [Morganella morganii]
MNSSARFDIADAILSLHGIVLWCAISGVICVIDCDGFQLVVSADR